MKNFTKYFGGEYIKYWYAAFGIILIVMIFSMVNDKSVTSYKLYIYNQDGTIKSEEEVPYGYYDVERLNLPVNKKFVPNKML